MNSKPLKPPPTYAIPILLLLFGFAMAGFEYYEVTFRSRVAVTGLFLVPGFILLCIIGLVDPRIPGSLQIPRSHEGAKN